MYFYNFYFSYLGTQLHLAFHEHVLEQRVIQHHPDVHREIQVVVSRHQKFKLALSAHAGLSHEEGLQVELGARGGRHRNVVEVVGVSHIPRLRRELLHDLKKSIYILVLSIVCTLFLCYIYWSQAVRPIWRPELLVGKNSSLGNPLPNRVSRLAPTFSSNTILPFLYSYISTYKLSYSPVSR